MIERQRVRDLATPRPQAYPGFAVASGGRLFVDTIRSSPGEARQAGLKMFRENGLRWSDLAADGYEIVSVSIHALGACRPDVPRIRSMT